MSLVTRNPTSNTTPDPGQGGLAVTTPSNTGHASTAADAAAGGGSQTKTCIWSGFGAPAGGVLSQNLKLSWAEDGTLGGGENAFRIEYSLNNGGAWSDVINHSIIEAPDSGDETIPLSTSQDPSLVKVRDKIFAQTNNAVCVGTVSNIRIEISVADPQVIIMM